MYPEHLRYTREHEWALQEGNRVRVGITHFAQQELGDVVYVELPAPGTTVQQGQRFAVVESVKAVSDIYAPVSGTVVEVNGRLSTEPELLNRDPYGEGWICLLELSNPAELETLLSAAQYRQLIGAGGGT
ncbi:MAG TPA: glycine cleavage system protein GcvH [Limnochordales bacterium]